CSIARAGRWLVCGQPDAPLSARETTETLGGFWCGRGQQFGVSQTTAGLDVWISVDGARRELALPAARIPFHYVATAVQALALIDRLPEDAVVSRVVADLHVDGRWQSFRRGEQTLVLDVAHNPQAAAYLRSQVPEVDCLILGMLSDKDVAGVICELPEAKKIYTVTLDCWRGRSAASTATDVSACGYSVAGQYESMADALAMMPEQGVTLAAGSFYTVEAASECINSGEGEWNSI
ncbi:MAG: hypothetical protein VW258_11390, partial [Thalassolituus sp.]